jgi:hypothetical protein
VFAKDRSASPPVGRSWAIIVNNQRRRAIPRDHAPPSRHSTAAFAWRLSVGHHLLQVVDRHFASEPDEPTIGR